MLSYYADFAFRFSPYYPNGHIYDPPTVDTTAVIIQETQAAAAAQATAWCWDFYLPSSIVHAADPAPQYEALNKGLEAYAALPADQKLLKFWLMVIIDDNYGLSYPSSAPWKYLDDIGAYVANLMLDPAYHRIEGLPALGLFTGGAGPALDDAHWDQFCSHFGGRNAVFTINMSGDPIAAQQFARAMFKYGVQNLGHFDGHIFYQQLVNADDTVALTPPAGLRHISQITPCGDERPVDALNTPTRTWTDQPTQAELYLHCNFQFGIQGSVQAFIIWNELGEEGPGASPTVGEGNRYCTAIAAARTGVLPAVDVSKMGLQNLRITASGGWVYVPPISGVNGAHERDLFSSNTVGDTLTLVVDNKIIWKPSASFEILCPLDPTYGSIEVFKNAVSQGVVSLNGPAQQQVSVKTVVLARGDTLVISVVAGPIAVDCLRITQ